MGIYNLMISALPTAMLSGGLVIAPLMAVFVILTQRKAQHSAARRAAGEASPGEA